MVYQNNISDWQENIYALPDEKFFEIIRLYLGDVKTPYNKQRLIEQLAGFIRNEKNLSSIISLLDAFDIKILTAIYFIPNATANLLIDFFAGDYSMGDVYAEVANLTLRLVIYSVDDKYSDKKFLKINPLLWDKLEAYIKISNILFESSVMSYSLDDLFTISPDFLAAFVSFINTYGCACKNDGTIKKNDANRLNAVFSGKLSCMQALLTAFSNLGLVLEGEKSYEIDRQRFELFARLENNQQYAMLCAASCSRFSRDGLKKEAQLFLDCVSSIPEGGYTRSTLIKLAFLTGTHSSDGTAETGQSRFSRILQAAKNQQGDLESQQNVSIIDRMLDFAIIFGLIQKKGLDEEGREVYIAGPAMVNQNYADYGQNGNKVPKVINIESTFTVTVMPGLNLKALLPLTAFLSIKNSGVVTEYEINRQSVSSAFDLGWTPEGIFEELQKYTAYELPQNLKITVCDWYNSYTSAMLYCSYVLKVAESNISFVENNPNIKKYIKEKLAEGIYLLNVPVTASISTFISESGLDFMGRVNNPDGKSERLPFPALRKGRALEIASDSTKLKINFSQAGEILKELKASLEAMGLEANQKESLNNKIRQRLILTPNQLSVASVRSEILEADGMDFSGKVHLFDAALKDGDVMEVTLPEYNNNGKYFTIVGKPLVITKQYADAIVRFEVFPDHEIENLVVSRITHLRRLKY